MAPTFGLVARMVGVGGPGLPFFQINIILFVVSLLFTSVRIIYHCHARQLGPDDWWISFAVVSPSEAVESVAGLRLRLISKIVDTSGQVFDCFFTIVNGVGEYIHKLLHRVKNFSADRYEDVGFGYGRAQLTLGQHDRRMAILVGSHPPLPELDTDNLILVLPYGPNFLQARHHMHEIVIFDTVSSHIPR